MPLFPDTPKTLLDELALDKEMDEAKWRRFDEMYRPVVAAFIVQRVPAVAHEAEDVAQETMIRLAAAVRERRYEAVRGKFRTFLGAIASNLVVDILRRHARYATLPLDTVDWISPSPADVPALAHLDRIEVQPFHTGRQQQDAEDGNLVQATAQGQADGAGDPDAGRRRQADDVAGLHDDAAAEEAEAAHDAGRHAGRIEPVRIRESVLGYNHKQAGAHRDQEMGPDAGFLAPEFALIADGGADDPGRDKPDAEFQCESHSHLVFNKYNTFQILFLLLG